MEHSFSREVDGQALRNGVDRLLRTVTPKEDIVQ